MAKHPGRKPVHIEAQGPQHGRNAIWSVIRRLKEFTLIEIRGEMPGAAKLNTIREYVCALQAAGNVEAFCTRFIDGRARAVYRLIRDVGVDAPRVRPDGSAVTRGRARQQMWRTMRILTEFTYIELAINASTEEYPVAESDAQFYCGYLAKAHYLKVVTPGKPGRPARYRLLPSRYTGPKPPMIQGIKQVFDPNTGRVVWPEAVPS